MQRLLRTARLVLIPRTRSETLAEVEHMTAKEKLHLSADWLELVRGSGSSSQWIDGFSVSSDRGHRVGACGYKGPPEAGVVEIAYGVAPEFEGRGLASEMAAALVGRAFESADVRVVRAHTLPEANQSTRVLIKNGFSKVGELVDPEDGRVWRWERRRCPDL